MTRLWQLIGAVVAVLVVGGVVFAAVDRLPVTTGWYWVIVTATTVGYGDVVPKTPHGRLVAAVVILVTIPLLSLVFARVTSLHVRKHLGGDLHRIQATADKAHRIAADTYRHHTGHDHPDAPNPTDEGNQS